MPFESAADPRFFFSTPEHEEALAALKYGVMQHRGITVVTGAPGSGKTLMGKTLMQSLGAQAYSATVSHTPDDAHDLIGSLCRGFEVRVRESHSSGELVARLESTLIQQHHGQMLCVAFIDEAQNLSIGLLEHLRMLDNLEVDSAKLLQVVLLGQPELNELLRSAQLTQLRQRIFCSRELRPLGRDQTREYLRHRLEIAGAANVALFTDEAADLIHECSGGLPRMINQIADNSLLVAYGASRTMIDRPTVAESIDQTMRLQVAPAITALAGDYAREWGTTKPAFNCTTGHRNEEASPAAAPLLLQLNEAMRRASDIARQLAETTRASERPWGLPETAGEKSGGRPRTGMARTGTRIETLREHLETAEEVTTALCGLDRRAYNAACCRASENGAFADPLELAEERLDEVPVITEEGPKARRSGGRPIQADIGGLRATIQTCRHMMATVAAERSRVEELTDRLNIPNRGVARAGGGAADQSRRPLSGAHDDRSGLITAAQRSNEALCGRYGTVRCMPRGDVAPTTESHEFDRVT